MKTIFRKIKLFFGEKIKALSFGKKKNRDKKNSADKTRRKKSSKDFKKTIDSGFKKKNFSFQKFQDSIQYRWKNEALFIQALCHKSYSTKHPDYPHNERLEFLGDAVLSLVVSDLLMKKFEGDSEGNLSRKRASIVNEQRLSYLATQMSLGSFLLIGKSKDKNQLRKNSRILASTFEAVVGAIYKDSDFQQVSRWLGRVLEPILDQAFCEHDFESDYKSRFQEWIQEEFKVTPSYKVISQKGPSHARVFEVEVFVGDEPWARGQGSSKKLASHKAARKALERRH